MSWMFLVWLLALMMNSGLLGITLHGLLQLADLENDYLNPHDATQSINRTVIPEYLLQATLAAMMLLTGNWILATLHTSVTIFHFRQFMLKKHLADVTEIFRQLKQLKKQVLVKLAIYLLAFVVVIHRLVEVIIQALTTTESRVAAKKLLQEAAAAMQ